MRKKVLCLPLSTLKFPISKNPEEPLVADSHSVINQAVTKPELKVSDLKSAMLCHVCRERIKIFIDQCSAYSTVRLGMTAMYKRK
jgi:cation-transporting ATPase 13A3/4/5